MAELDVKEKERLNRLVNANPEELFRISVEESWSVKTLTAMMLFKIAQGVNRI